MQETRSIHDSTNRPNIEFIAYIYILLYIKHEIIYNLGNETVCWSVDRKSGTASVNKDSRVLFCICNSGVTRCQPKHQCHFWRINLIFEAYCTGKRACDLSIKFMSFMRLWTVAKILRFLSSKACFENVNIQI